jgi:uncharacterized protein YcfJ
MPRALGGTDHLNNLYAACVSCNRSKGTLHTRTVRARHGRARAPLSRSKRETARGENAFLGGVFGGLVGALMGPGVAIVCGLLGLGLGYHANPDDV